MDLTETNYCENRHPWELSRFHNLSRQIRKYHKSGSVLDIGCGDSFFDRELLKEDIPITEIYGIDVFLKDGFDEKNYHVVNDYRKLKDKKFDTVIMFDVLEHIEKDDDFLNDVVYGLLKDNGKIIITVPAFQYLFSEHDKFLKHFRRYDQDMMRELIKKTGFRITEMYYFYFSLYLFRSLFKNKSNDVSHWKHGKTSIVTRFFNSALNIDYSLSKLFAGLPGLSLFVVLEKKSE